MFKKLLGSIKDGVSGKNSPPKYDVPEVLPSLDPDAQAVTAKMKLPDSIKKYMTAQPKAEIPSTGEAVAKAADIAAEESAADAGQALAQAVEASGGQSAPLLGSLLKDPRFALISVKFLAFGMSKESAVLWAAESASLGYALALDKDPSAPAMSPEEQQAVAQAQAFAKGEEFSAEKATAAAQELGMDKPGALAAQAAAWSDEPLPVEEGVNDELVGNMVSAAVLLAAAMTIPSDEKEPPAPQLDAPAELEPPPLKSMPLLADNKEEVMPMAKALKPFIDKGLQIAAMG